MITGGVRRTKVLVILPSYDSGGAENYALRLIRHAGNDGYDWHVTTGNVHNAVLEDAFRRAGSQLHHASPGYGDPRQVILFVRFLRHHRFDTIMSMNGVFGGLSLSLARLARVPRRIAWHRRSTPAHSKTPLRRLYARIALFLLSSCATRILSNSQAALDNFHGPNLAQSKKFAVIPNGVDTDRFKQHPHVREEVRKELCIPKDAQVIGHIGRVDPAKDHETLIAVVARLRQSQDNLELLLAGTDTDSAAFEQRLERAGIRAITHALGVRSDVDRLYQAMDVFLFPSLTEGQPNALIEAMLSGVQMVATDIPGIRSTVPPCLVSRLFPPKDISAASQLVATTLSDCNPVDSYRTWLEERYDLSLNLNIALKELDPSTGGTDHA